MLLLLLPLVHDNHRRMLTANVSDPLIIIIIIIITVTPSIHKRNWIDVCPCVFKIERLDLLLERASSSLLPLLLLL